MTHAKQTRLSAIGAGWLVVVWTALLGAQESGGILSNDIWALAGDGDYLWMLSGKGLNFTVDAFAPSPTWHELPSTVGTQYVGPLIHGARHVLVGVAPAENSKNAGDLLLFPEGGGTPQRIAVRYQLDAIRKEVQVLAWDAAWGAGSFWVTMLDGGLLQIDPASSPPTVTLRVPGVERTFTPSTFITDSLGNTIGSPEHTPVLVETDSAAGDVWVACSEKLWRLSRVDSGGSGGNWMWDSVSVDTLGSVTFVGLAVKPRPDTSVAGALFVTVVSDDGDTLLYRHDPDGGAWQRVRLVRGRDVARLFVFGTDPYLYVNHGGQLSLYADSASRLEFLADMMSRVRDENSPAFEPSDVLLTRKDGVERLWVATPGGLYFSSDGLYDPAETKAFSVVKRANRIESDLKETYAYPSIIAPASRSAQTKEAVFAYDLAENDHVTIDVFDWNMDHVVRIIDDQARQAGRASTRGRSSVEKYDRWDGTLDNRGGKPVTPGVYYYRISTRKGKRAFGKIIVAGN